MKIQTLLSQFMLALIIAASGLAQDQTWKVVSIPGVCTYQIPPTVEIQKGLYKKITKPVVDEYIKEILEINKLHDRVVAQQKGINSFNPKSFKRYCRIIVETEYGKRGEFLNLDDPLALSPGELEEVNTDIKSALQILSDATQSTVGEMKILTWNHVKIVRVSGADALKISYTRSVNKAPPVLVNTYIIQNNNTLHKITLSYPSISQTSLVTYCWIEALSSQSIILRSNKKQGWGWGGDIAVGLARRP